VLLEKSALDQQRGRQASGVFRPLRSRPDKEIMAATTTTQKSAQNPG